MHLIASDRTIIYGSSLLPINGVADSMYEFVSRGAAEPQSRR
ncbi:hypothetical protein ACF3DV_11680 [Chlorogloeopsis fritschii PCC 9212]|nr:hypothetical protein [Chlorogloeopsis fritschii]